ncbi:hypothetical protein PCAR4_350146 [Paraburkholderia caribensis]|nr:hypothetical protein PCAR4_350146 [Paraburkholderia caribensis]
MTKFSFLAPAVSQEPQTLGHKPSRWLRHDQATRRNCIDGEVGKLLADVYGYLGRRIRATGASGKSPVDRLDYPRHESRLGARRDMATVPAFNVVREALCRVGP